MKFKTLSHKIITIGLFALTLIPLVFTYWTSNYHILKIIVSQGIIITTFIFWQIKLSRQQNNPAASPNTAPPQSFFYLKLAVIIYLLINLISMVKSINIFESLNSFFQLFNYIILFFIISSFIDSTKKIKQLVRIMIFTGFMVSLYGLLQIIGINNPYYQPPPPGSSTLGNINYAAGFIIIIIPLTLSAILSAKNYYKKGLLSLALLLMAVHLYHTHCCGAWLAALISLPFMAYFLTGSKRIKRNIALITSGFTGIILIIIIMNHINLINIASYYAPFRLMVWKSTLTLISHNPLLGTGIGNFFLIYPQYRHYTEWQTAGHSIQTLRAHNDYLEIAAETGLLGLAAFIGILIAAYYIFKSIRTRTSDRQILFLSTGIFAGITATLIHSFFSFNLHRPSSALYFWYCLGLLACLRNITTKTRSLNNNIPASLVQSKARFSFSLLKTKIPRLYKFLNFNRLYKNLAVWIVCITMLIMFIRTSLLPLIGDMHYQKAKIHEHRHEYQKALVSCEKSISAYHPRIDSHFMKGRLHEELQQYSETIKEMEIVLKLHPNYPWAHQTLGTIYLKQSQLDKGAEYFQQAARFHPWYNNYIAAIYIQENKLDKALPLIAKAMTTGFKPEVTWTTLSMFYEKKNKPELARRAYNKALNISREHFPAHLRLAELYSRHRQYKRSIPYYRRAIRLKPENQKARLGLIIACLETKDFEKAVKQGKILVSLRPSLWNSHALLALAYEQLKNYPAAKKEWQKVLKLDPTNLTAKKHLICQ